MRIFTYLLFILTFSLSGLTQAETLYFNQGAIELQALFDQPPKVNKESFLRLTFFDASTHQPLAITAKIEVIPWMPSMGHGTSPTQVEPTLDETQNVIVGSFDVRKIYFIMGGTWEVKVVLTDVDGNKETQTFNVKPTK